MTVLFDEIIGGGGGQNDMFAPPPKKKIFHGGGGGGDCSPAPPGSTPLGASDLDEQGGMCTVADPGFAKKGVGGKIRARSAPCVREARASYGWGPGARRRAPEGAEPPEALEFSANKGLQDGRQE